MGTEHVRDLPLRGSLLTRRYDDDTSRVPAARPAGRLRRFAAIAGTKPVPQETPVKTPPRPRPVAPEPTISVGEATTALLSLVHAGTDAPVYAVTADGATVSIAALTLEAPR